MPVRPVHLFAAIRESLGNPLYQLIAAQLFFLFLGINFLEFNVSWLDVCAAVAIAVIGEVAFANAERKLRGERGYSLFFPGSAIAAALGIGIFFRAVNPWYFALAALVAVGSKYVVRIQGAHLFNPSNFAIVLLVFTLPAAATIEFTQWGANPYVYALVAAISLAIAYRAGVIVTTLSFLAAYAALLLMFVSYAPFQFSVHHYGLLGPSLILFASFMITDPRTSPSGRFPRILHGVSVACLFFVLEWFGVRYGLFVASFTITVLNLASRLTLSHLFYAARRMPQNALAAAGAMIATFVLGLFVVYASPPTSALETVARRFILMGVESPRIEQCSANPQFVPRPDVPFVKTSTWANGAAWGDYDGDGDDDIFVSTLDAPSRLYENEGGDFTDQTENTGLPSMNTQSAFFADYDNDGNRDLFVVFGVEDYERSRYRLFEPTEPVIAVRLFRNTGHRFEEVTEQTGLSEFKLPLAGGTLSFADYNTDGYLDFVYAGRAITTQATVRSNTALQKSSFDPRFNLPVRFICDKPTALQLSQDLSISDRFPTPWLEKFFDQGGCLFTHTDLPVISFDPGARELGTPFNAALWLPGSVHLFENKGGMAFTERTEFRDMIEETRTASVHVPLRFGERADEAHAGQYYQPVSFDYDQDRRPDIFISVDYGTSLLLRNTGDFTFENATTRAGLNYVGSGMGADVTDYDRDGLLDIVVDNIRSVYLYRNNGDGTFTNKYEEFGLARTGEPWGIVFLDYDRDGWDDLYIANGHVNFISDAPNEDLARALFRGDKLYRNVNGVAFDDVSAEICPDSQSALPAAAADYDADGDMDIFVGNVNYTLDEGRLKNASNTFYENTLSDPDTHHVAVRLLGTKSGTDAAGAVVRIESGSGTQTKTILVGSSFYAQNSHDLYFGLGTDPAPVSITVTWPMGGTTRLNDVETDRVVHITER